MLTMTKERPTDDEAMRRALSARTKAGLEAARARGQRLGAPPVLDAAEDAKIRAERDRGVSVRKLADRYEVGENTIRRSLARTIPANDPGQGPEGV